MFAAHAAGARCRRSPRRGRRSPRRCSSAQIAGPQTWAALGALSGDIAAQVRATWRTERMCPPPPCRTCATTCIWSARRSVWRRRPQAAPHRTPPTLKAYRERDRQPRPSSSRVGQGGGRDRARSRHHGRLEAHRRDGRREDRQEPPDLRRRVRRPSWSPRRRSARPTRSACRSRPRTCCPAAWPERCGQRLGAAMEHGAQHRLAWVLTLPAAMLLAGSLYWLLRQVT